MMLRKFSPFCFDLLRLRSTIEKGRGDKGGFMSLQSIGSGRIASSFSDMRISGGGGGGFGSGSGFGLSTGIESFSAKSKAVELSHPSQRPLQSADKTCWSDDGDGMEVSQSGDSLSSYNAMAKEMSDDPERVQG
ncbi:hypothetical protein SO802_018365 [Lithocarpus litseifolius]|uniref:Uncharacterized protein n=1 Tax=Lithocarpus litseifolius TaxID=425828 RepID=A0AAW2CMX9_9ROSI